MAGPYGAKTYKQTAVLTASKPQLLIMLYEAAIKHLRTARVALEKQDLAAKGTAIGKTHDIVNELVNSLDFEVGGQIAKDLERLYIYITDQLLKANLENDGTALEASEKILRNLLDGWRQAILSHEREQSSADDGVTGAANVQVAKK